MEENTQQLKKNITFFPALAMVMGTVIGSGVFFKTSNVAEVTGSVSLTMFAWFLGGIITICAGLTCAELAAAMPEAGGLTNYITQIYGSFWGFLAGWAQSVIYFPANIAAIAIIFGTQVVNLLGLASSWLVPIAMLSALSLLLLNFLGSKAGAILQSVTLVVKLIPIILIVVVGLMRPSDVAFSLFPIAAGAGKNLVTGLGAGLLATMFAYDGWIHVGNIAAEMVNPKRDLPRAIGIGLAGVMVVYLLINAVFLKTLPFSDFPGNSNAASDVAQHLFGNGGGKLITIGILVSVYGTLNGYIMSGMRIPYAMANDDMIPFAEKFKKLTKHRNTPFWGGVLQFVIALIMMLSNAFDMLTNMLIFVIWLFYTMAFFGVMLMRKKAPDLARPYKVPGYPVIPIIAGLGGIFILVSTIFTQTGLALIGIGLTALGIPLYLYHQKHQQK